MDMHSGGGQKLSHAKILIEASEAEAEIIFQNRFGRNPHRVTCTCCGPDYSITESATLEDATGYDRGCLWSSELDRYVDEPDASYRGKRYQTLDQYLASDAALVIRKDEIKPEERIGDLHLEGWVWED
jgi:hypothetical protein